MRKKLLTAICAGVVMLSTAHLNPSASTADIVGSGPIKIIKFDRVYATTNLRVRSGPGLENDQIGLLEKGHYLISYDYDPDIEWTLVEYGVEMGYVYTDFLTLSEKESLVEEAVYEGCGVTEAAYPQYSVNGSILDEGYMWYAYKVCQDFGIEYYYPYLLCQMYQESRFNQNAISKNGMDYGLMQLRLIYVPDILAECGYTNADIVNNGYDNIYVGTYLMAKNLNLYGGNIEMALSRYYLGVDQYCAEYVHDVLQWYPTLLKIN